jgi:hypothetical protein
VRRLRKECQPQSLRRRDGQTNLSSISEKNAFANRGRYFHCGNPMHMAIITAMRVCHLARIGALILVFVPAPAQAQPNSSKENTARLIRKIGIHGNVSYRHPLDSDVTKGRSYGVSIGLAPGRTNGWRYPFALSFFTQDLHSPNGDEFASVRTRALLGGIGYGWHFGRFSTGVQFQTGYAWNHPSLKGDIEHAFNVPPGTVSIDVENSFLLRPEVKAEYFLTPKFTLRVSGDYVYLHPGIRLTTPTQTFERRWDESNLHANFGVAFYPFRK